MPSSASLLPELCKVGCGCQCEPPLSLHALGHVHTLSFCALVDVWCWLWPAVVTAPSLTGAAVRAACVNTKRVPATLDFSIEGAWERARVCVRVRALPAQAVSLLSAPSCMASFHAHAAVVDVRVMADIVFVERGSVCVPFRRVCATCSAALHCISLRVTTLRDKCPCGGSLSHMGTLSRDSSHSF
jgi:hypothetical protein